MRCISCWNSWAPEKDQPQPRPVCLLTCQWLLTANWLFYFSFPTKGNNVLSENVLENPEKKRKSQGVSWSGICLILKVLTVGRCWLVWMFTQCFHYFSCCWIPIEKGNNYQHELHLLIWCLGMTGFIFFILHGPACNATTSWLLFASFSPLLFKVDDFPSSGEFSPADLPAAWTLDTLECSWDDQCTRTFPTFSWPAFLSFFYLLCQHKERLFFFPGACSDNFGSLFPPKLEELFLERK